MTVRFLTLALLLSSALHLFAEEPEPRNGRLPDGRAFRTDSQGNQLVDYIAELEVNVDALNRRVQGLEYELEQKQAQLAGTGVKAGPAQVAERDLLKAEDSFSCPACPDKACPEVDCSLLLQQDSAAGEARDRAQKEAVAQLQGDLEIEKRMHTIELSQLKTRITELEGELTTRNSELSDKSGILQAKDKEIEKLKLSQAQQRDERQEEQNRAQFSAVKMRALESVRGTLQTEFNQVRALLSTRAKLLGEHGNSKNVVSFRPNAPRSSDGESLDQIKTRIASAQSVGELNRLHGPLGQIRGKLNEDLALLKRIKR